ncbi:unnamed protein product [Rotaria magnacalcarata]|uniref:V-type proton ATPase subunit G n=1 Tax=Rotaria magnacalcarata TaxID=392030 RepID=A0A816QJJ4_9BILA|nr:unnamed protein product [Rotaria magnacalcarata]CAF1626689.1 unnamed protein product [Rotaria magnacalcarata]CAF2060999.1 unnamed protein product [Rotaria magnacalcarata]CAF2079663.1 unnamed protein product [Rotaria magnacalcarata]CAF2083172.1 unnamed protein product [Rotaria magnacalcarata]
MLQSRGITDLLVAEKKAQEIIEEARKRKNKRIKDAQNEAKFEIELFKGERDQHYKALEQQQLGNRDKMAQESNVQTQIDIESLKAKYDSNKDELLERILTTVCDVKPQSHINARIE